MAYLSFPDFMEKKRYRFQSRLWEGDPMYRSKIWKAHRQEYARVCRFGKYANDQKLLDEEVMQYERRILEARRNSGMLTEKEFRQLQGMRLEKRLSLPRIIIMQNILERFLINVILKRGATMLR